MSKIGKEGRTLATTCLYSEICSFWDSVFRFLSDRRCLRRWSRMGVTSRWMEGLLVINTREGSRREKEDSDQDLTDNRNQERRWTYALV
jgi:hypothetical protein